MIRDYLRDGDADYLEMLRLFRCRPRRPSSWAVILLLVVVSLLLIFLILKHNNSQTSQILFDSAKIKHPRNIDTKSVIGQKHSMCMLVPFRDRFEELTEFVPRITKFLQQQNIDHKIIVINQVWY